MDYLRYGTVFILGALFFHIAAHLEEYQIIGMEIILALQKYRSFQLDVVMRLFTIFGFETFFLILPLLVWSGKRETQVIGVNLSFIMHFNLLLITAFKLVFMEERPVWINTSIEEYQGHSDFSFPSGHSWGTTIAWLFISFSFKKIAVRIFSIFIILMTAFSRVYFGVHYPHDVVAGISLGTIVFLLRDHLLLLNLEDANNLAKPLKVNRRNRKFFILAFLWTSITFLIFYLVEETLRDRHIGLPYSVGAIGASMFLVPTITVLEDTPSKQRTSFRVILGLIPVFCVIYATYYLYLLEFAWLDEIIMMVGVTHMLWLYFGAGIFFQKIGLGTKHKVK